MRRCFSRGVPNCSLMKSSKMKLTDDVISSKRCRTNFNPSPHLKSWTTERSIVKLALLVLAFTALFQSIEADCPEGSVPCSSLTISKSATLKGRSRFSSSEASSEEDCVATDQVCDGNYDCANGEDETKEGCEGRGIHATASHKLLEKMKSFLDKSGQDGQSGSQSSKSSSSGQKMACKVSDFVCHNGRCLSKAFVCDGNDDCGDQTDETGCETGSGADSGSNKQKTCSRSQFSCGPGTRQCILKNWVCDGNVDCPGGIDEKNCSCDGFKCRNGKCIPEKWKCDGISDCSDSSDEESCGMRRLASAENCIYWCKDEKKCLPSQKVCDKVLDCPDGSDEDGQCDPTHCLKSPCQHHCLATPDGPRCYCQPGFQLTSNGKNCTDTNECESPGWCSHKCQNLVGTFKCKCQVGYDLDPKDNRTCTAVGYDPLLLLAAGSEIRGLYLRGDQYYFLVYDSPRDIISLAFDGVDSMVYWTTATKGYEGVYRGKLDGSSKPELVASGLTMPEGVAVDWVGRNVYITDSTESKPSRSRISSSSSAESASTSPRSNDGNGPPRIIVCSADGAMCHTLITKGLDKPRAIVLHPEEGIMFWSDWGAKPQIVRAGMDGSDVTPIVKTGVAWPNGLAIDLPLNDLYWVDAKLDRIEAIHIDGSNRRVVLEDYVRHPFSLSVFEDTIYWSDWSRKEIRSVNKFTGKNRKVLVKTKGHLPMGIHVHHPVIQAPVSSPCWGSQCSHLCLIGPDHSFKCACPVGFRLLPDARTCTVDKPQEQIILSADNRLLALTPQDIGRDILESYQFPKLRRIGALDYDRMTGRVVVSDVVEKGIYSLSMKDRNSILVASDHMDNVEGLAVDFLGRNVYWVDASRGTVEVARLPDTPAISFYAPTRIPREDSSSQSTSSNKLPRKILVEGLEHPTDIALVPWKGLMFVAASGDHAHIDSFSMDGKNHRHLVEVNVGHPVSLCSDDDMHRIFWTDSKNGVIESVMWDGTGRIVFKQFVSQPFDLAILGNNFYWTDVHSRDIHWTSKYGFQMKGGRAAKSMMIIPTESMAPSMMKIASVSFEEDSTSIVVGASHGCAVNNGGCQHLCLPVGDGNKVCMCPTGMRIKMTGNDTDCAEETVCGSSEFACKSKKCIPRSWICDGRRDCKSGEDELNCTNGTRLSKGGQESSGTTKFSAGCTTDYKWECADGSCIPRTWLCDAHPDCHDGSDEKECPPAGCSASQFRCSNGQCVSKRWRCDGDEDCDDGSDERECSTGNAEHCIDPSDFRCANGQCIAKGWKCDKSKDCHDGSDEQGCSLTCTVGAEFRCPSDNLCISTSMVCDGKVDCDSDAADEASCASFYSTSTNASSVSAGGDKKPCTSNQFECQLSGMCIPMKSRCDGKVDCQDGKEDELGCCGTTEFTCSGGSHCIHESWVCDGHADCADGADEAWGICSMATTSTSSSTKFGSQISSPAKTCSTDEYQCYTGDCVPLISACDGHPDCKDGSDEGIKCNMSCQSNPCGQTCFPTPDGPVCRCLAGYYLMHDGATCDDIDECEVFRRVWAGPVSQASMTSMIECSQYCTNRKGTFKCSCAEGYRLDEDRVTCRLSQGKAGLLVSSAATSQTNGKNSLQVLTIGSFLTTVKSLPISGSGANITAIDSDARSKRIYWVDGWEGSVKSFSEKSGRIKTVLKGLKRPNHLAFDWVAKNAFVTERPGPGIYSISVCALNANKRICRTIHANEKRYIGGIAIAPFDGYIFWSSWSPGRKELLPYGFIRRSNMDGSDVFYVAADKVSQPMGIALDSILRRVYWADAHKGTIEYANWNGAGSPVELKLARIQVPFSVAVFEANVIWNDLGSTAILIADRRFENSTKVLKRKVLPTDLRIYHTITQPPYPQVDPCNDPATTNCSHLCVLMPSGFACLCPDGYTKVSDYSCQEQLTERLEIPSIHTLQEQTGKLVNEDILMSARCDAQNPCKNGGTCVIPKDRLTETSYCICAPGYHGPRCIYDATEEIETWRKEKQQDNVNAEQQDGETNSAGVVAAAVICTILVFFMILVGCHYYYSSRPGIGPIVNPAGRFIQSVQFRKPKNFRLLANDSLQEATAAQESQDGGHIQMGQQQNDNCETSNNNRYSSTTFGYGASTDKAALSQEQSDSRTLAFLKTIVGLNSGFTKTKETPVIGLKNQVLRPTGTGFTNYAFGINLPSLVGNPLGHALDYKRGNVKKAMVMRFVAKKNTVETVTGYNPLSDLPENVITGSPMGLSASMDLGVNASKEQEAEGTVSAGSSPGCRGRSLSITKEPRQLKSSASFEQKNVNEDLLLISSL